jgi:glycine betaine catabolism B
MKVTVKGALRDTVSFILHIKKRKRLFRRAGAGPLNPGAMNLLASRLHPRRQLLRVETVRQETPSTKTFRLVPAHEGGRVAYFKAGQYIAVEEEVDGTAVSRPFSLSSTPAEAAEGSYYEITIKSGETDGENEETAVGFFAPWSLREWKPGRRIVCSEPMGTFTYEALRDAAHVVCLAGGSGITPFKSIISDALSRSEEPAGEGGGTKGRTDGRLQKPRFTLLYGVTDPSEIIFKKELAELAERFPGRFSMTVVVSGPAQKGSLEVGGENADFETGFITEELIRRRVKDPEKASFFVCGPPAMQKALESEFAPFGLKPKQLRKESYGRAAGDLPDSEGSPAASGAASTAASYTITVRVDHGKTAERLPIKVPARPLETVLLALERAGLNPPALCRSGECGWCRSKLVSGEIFSAAGKDGTRGADKKFGWFHPCASYPKSDLEIEVPRNPIRQTEQRRSR